MDDESGSKIEEEETLRCHRVTKPRNSKPFWHARLPSNLCPPSSLLAASEAVIIDLHDLASKAMEVEDASAAPSTSDAELTTQVPQAAEPPSFNGPDLHEAGSSAQARKPGGRPKSFVWQYYTQHTDANFKSKRCEVSCNFCETRMLSRVEQMESHLAQNCPRCPADVKDHMRDRIFAAKELSKAKKEALERGEQIAKASSSLLQQPIFSPLSQPFAKRQKMDGTRDSQHPIPLRLRFPQVECHVLWGSATCREKQLTSQQYCRSVSSTVLAFTVLVT